MVQTQYVTYMSTLLGNAVQQQVERHPSSSSVNKIVKCGMAQQEVDRKQPELVPRAVQQNAELTATPQLRLHPAFSTSL